MFILIEMHHEARTTEGTMKLLGTYNTRQQAYGAMLEAYGSCLFNLHSECDYTADDYGAVVRNEQLDQWNWAIFDSENPKELFYQLDTYAWDRED